MTANQRDMVFRLVGWGICLIAVSAVDGLAAAQGQAQQLAPIGVAEVDITPQHPVRLNGYGGRRDETDEVVQPIYAKALAFGADDDPQGPAVLVAADQLGVTKQITDEVAARVEAKAGVPRERFALTVSHSHTTPMLTNALPTIFGVPIPDDHQANIDRYTRFFIDRCVEAAIAALADREPAYVELARGSVGFAYNRRALRGDPHGPNDHQLPIMAIRNEEGDLRAVYVTYACHCTVLSQNFISGDWAGYAQEHIQQDHPGAIALVSIGCGADQNPYREERTVERASEHGREIADEVNRLFRGPWRPIEPRVRTARYNEIPLAFEKLPSRAEWERRAKGSDRLALQAQGYLERMEQGEQLPTHLDYVLQTWQFGDDLAMVFMAGEVVVDYTHRLRRELDADRLWINAYANDVPCYIPSERVLREGGYEGETAMAVYNQPNRFAPGLEEQIIEEIVDQVGDAYGY